jgi:hypothetical protein
VIEYQSQETNAVRDRRLTEEMSRVRASFNAASKYVEYISDKLLAKMSTFYIWIC